MHRGDVAHLRRQGADVGFDGFDAREEVLVGDDAGWGDVLDMLALLRLDLARHGRCIRGRALNGLAVLRVLRALGVGRVLMVHGRRILLLSIAACAVAITAVWVARPVSSALPAIRIPALLTIWITALLVRIAAVARVLVVGRHCGGGLQRSSGSGRALRRAGGNVF